MRNVKQRPQPQDYNNFSQQNRNPHKKTKDFKELKKKSNSILILTDSMSITLHMGVFNQFLQGGKTYLELFPGATAKQLHYPGAKAKQLHYHAATVLAQHQYDSAIIHVGINNILNGSSTEQISKDVIEIAQLCRNRSIGFCL